MKVRDKHHVGLSSTNMEKEAFKKIARRRLSNMLKVVEVASDASASIKKLIDRTGKRNGKDQGLGRPYTVIQHFWYCSSVSKLNHTTSDGEALKVMKNKWIGLLLYIMSAIPINGEMGSVIMKKEAATLTSPCLTSVTMISQNCKNCA